MMASTEENRQNKVVQSVEWINYFILNWGGNKMGVILYTIHCPKCDVLEQKLNIKGIKFEKVDDIATIQAKGMDTMPMLEVDGELYDFSAAVKWVNSQKDIDGNN